MPRVTKISEKQFILDCINKEFELVDSGIHFDTYTELEEYAQLHREWFAEYFMTPEQYASWKEYFFEHFYDWKPKRYKKKLIEDQFGWFSLNWGFGVTKEN